MINHGLLENKVHKRAPNTRTRLWLRRLSAFVGAALGALVLAVTVLLLVFGGAILNGYGKGKVEREFAESHPGCALRIGKLDYAMGANRLVAQSVTLTAPNSTLQAGRISLTGVRWARALWGKAPLADILARAGLEATNLVVEFPRALYGIRCARLRASVPASELIAEGTELEPLVDDEDFFAAHEFRATRFQVVVPECRVLGLAYGELFQGSSYRARAVHFSRPSFDALVNRDKPPPAFVKSPLLVHEALAFIRQPLQIGSLDVTNGRVAYCERLAVGADPAVLTFGDVSLSAEGIANRGDATTAIQLRGQGDLMETGTINVQMSIPIISTNFALHYSGSLRAMDLSRLDGFLEIAEHTRMKSGSAQEASFDIEVTAGQARGQVRAIYRDLEITLLDKKTGNEDGLANRAASFLAKVLKIRKANPPGGSGSGKAGEVNYTRKPDDEFLQFVWFALRTGVLDVITH